MTILPLGIVACPGFLVAVGLLCAGIAPLLQVRGNVPPTTSPWISLPESKWIYRVNCPASVVPSELCNATQSAVAQCLSRFHRLLDLREGITVTIELMDPCENQFPCAPWEFLASGVPKDPLPLRIPQLARVSKRVPAILSSNAFVPGYEGVYTVPSALAKQMDISNFPPREPTATDIEVLVNFRKEYYYNGPNEKVNGKYDLELILMREILVRCGLSW
jgi:hypothetical protein